MSDRDPIAKETRDEAAQWYARLSNSTVSTQTLRDFRAWKQIGDNLQAYMDIDAFWKKAGLLQGDDEIAKAAQDALNRKSPADLLKGPGGKGALGALLVVGLGAALAYGYQRHLGTPYETSVGEQRTVRLSDGSKLLLDTDTQLRVRLSGKARRIDLQSGQAFFEVAHDASRPFIVRAGETEVRALGTRFDVRRAGEVVRVVLVEGKVRVDAGAGDKPASWTLAPNQQLRVDERAEERPQAIDAAAATSWTTGRLVFSSQPLSAAVAEVNRYSRTKVVITDPNLAATPVSGSFESGDTEAFVNAVKDLHDLRIASRDAREIRLEPAV